MRREEPSFRARLTGAALLRRSVYEDVVADDATTGQAVGVVVLAALAQGFGVFAEAGAATVVLDRSRDPAGGDQVGAGRR